jgi:ankyrin repeat protein
VNPDKDIWRPPPDAYDRPFTPLWAALRDDDEDAVCNLVSSGGSDPNEWGVYDGGHGNSGSALGYALVWGLERAVECLLAAGADPNAQNQHRMPVLVGARSPWSVRVMVAAGADVTAVHDRNGRSVLHILARLADAATVVEAVGLGADVNHRDAWGHTPVFGAGSVEVSRALVETGADPLAVDEVGMNAVWVAAMDGDLERVRYLLELGCDARQVDPIRGITAAECARVHQHPDVADFIEQWPPGRQATRVDATGAVEVWESTRLLNWSLRSIGWVIEDEHFHGGEVRGGQ